MNKIFLIFLVIALMCGIYWYYMKFNSESRTTSKKNVSLKKNIFDSEESLKSFDTQFLSESLDNDTNDTDNSHEKVNRQKKVESEYSKDSIDSQISQNSLHSSYFANSESNNSDEESQTNNSDANSQSNESQSNDSQSNELHSDKDSDFTEDW